MAGVQLLKNMHRPGSLDDLVTHFGDDWWQEPFRFFIGHVDDADLFDSFMQKLFDSPVTDRLTPKQQDLLVSLVEEAPLRKINALEKKLFDPSTSPNRQQYLQECLKKIGKPEALDAVKKFAEFGRNNVLFDKLGAEYILIKGGTFTYSVTEKPEMVPDLYVAKYTVTNKQYRQFIDYLNAKESVFAKNLPVKIYIKALRAEACKIDRFKWYLKKENKDMGKHFCSESDYNNKFNEDVWEWTIFANDLCSVRGGSWDLPKDYLRCDARFIYHPEFFSNSYVGFRVIRSSPLHGNLEI